MPDGGRPAMLGSVRFLTALLCLTATTFTGGCGATARRSPPALQSSAARTCRVGRLRFVGYFGGGSGNAFGSITIVNRSRAACTLRGYPRVTVVAGGRPWPASEHDGGGLLVPARVLEVGVPSVGSKSQAPEFDLVMSNYCGPVGHSTRLNISGLPGDPHASAPIALAGKNPFVDARCEEFPAANIDVGPFVNDGGASG
jgi:hypothetical protein